MAPITLDASVAVKWLLRDEEHVTHALALRAAIVAHDLAVVVPPNFPIEVAHALVRAVRRGRYDPDDLDRGIQAIMDLDCELDVRPEIAVGAASLAHRLRTSAHDAAYLVVAKSRGATFITADRALRDAGLAAGFDVAWLADLPV